MKMFELNYSLAVASTEIYFDQIKVTFISPLFIRSNGSFSSSFYLWKYGLLSLLTFNVHFVFQVKKNGNIFYEWFDSRLDKYKEKKKYISHWILLSPSLMYSLKTQSVRQTKRKKATRPLQNIRYLSMRRKCLCNLIFISNLSHAIRWARYFKIDYCNLCA